MTPQSQSSLSALAKLIALAIYDKHKSLANETGKNLRENTKHDLLSPSVARVLSTDLVSGKNA